MRVKRPLADAGEVQPYVPRLLDGHLSAILAAFAAVLLLGPRAMGKTTTARRFEKTVVELNDPAQTSTHTSLAGSADDTYTASYQ